MLAWSICDLQQNELVALRRREGGTGRVVIPLGKNGHRTAQVQVGLSDPASAQVIPLCRLAKVYMDRSLIFVGPIITPSKEDQEGGGEAGKSATINAIGPDYRLERSFLLSFATQTGVDQAEILARLMEAAAPTSQELGQGVQKMGLIRGNLPASIARDRTYDDGKQVWEAFTQLAEVRNGPDFDFRPVEASNGDLAALDTYYPQQGTDRRASVRLDYNLGRHNAVAFSFRPAGDEVCNRFYAVGVATDGSNTAPAYVAENKDSQKLYGILEDWQSYSDITTIQGLQDNAESEIGRRAFPPELLDITPAPSTPTYLEGQKLGVPPRFAPPTAVGPGQPGGDYWLGDTITARARVLPGIDLNLPTRIVQAEIIEQPNGRETLNLIGAPVVEYAGVTGFATTVSIPITGGLS